MFSAPSWRPRVCQAVIVVDADGLYGGAQNGSDLGRVAQVAVVADDVGEAWGSVAWCSDNVSEWWIGRFPFPPHATHPPIMGAAEIMFAADVDADVLLVGTPARYVELATSAKWPGPCATILDWGRPDAVALWLSLVKAVQCETPEIACAVRAALDAEPAKQRLRIRIADPAAPATDAEPARVDFEPGTILEPFALPKSTKDEVLA